MIVFASLVFRYISLSFQFKANYYITILLITIFNKFLWTSFDEYPISTITFNRDWAASCVPCNKTQENFRTKNKTGYSFRKSCYFKIKSGATPTKYIRRLWNTVYNYLHWSLAGTTICLTFAQHSAILNYTTH